MQMYAILRPHGWRTPEELEAAAIASRQVGDEQMPDAVRWIRGYALSEDDGTVGAVCIYQATDPDAIRQHARIAELSVDEIVPIAGTVIVRADPERAIV
jgi:hypothetical protein